MIFLKPLRLSLLYLSLMDGLSSDFISHCLCFSDINVVLGISLLHVGNLFQFLFNCFSLMHLTNKVGTKLVVHHHVHVIRGESGDAELDMVEVLANVLRKWLGVFTELGGFFGLFKTFVLVFAYWVEILFEGHSLPFEADWELLLENLKLKKINISLLSFFMESHELIKSHQHSLRCITIWEISKHTLWVKRGHPDCKSFKTSLKVIKRYSLSLFKIKIGEPISKSLEPWINVRVNQLTEFDEIWIMLWE